MKCQIPEISWHNRDPVLSIDIQPINHSRSGKRYHRLASGGSDTHVLIWHLTYDSAGAIEIEIAADLTRHQRAVNAVRWSPSGSLLASGDDESIIFIWKQKEDTEVLNILDSTNDSDKEIWLVQKVLRGHMEDVYDLSWAPNSKFLISGSVDNTAIVWDVLKGKQTNILQEAKGFVQGVAWDPKNQFLATLSTDRYLRVYDNNTKKVLSKNSKCILPFPTHSPLHTKVCRLFHDDTLQTFFRRLCFSPDGNLLVVPCGVVDIDNVVDKKLHTSYIYTRNSWRQPAIVLPSPEQYTVVVKFSPLLYKLRHVDSKVKMPILPLPYRMIFAVATKCSVFLYDTQQSVPFGTISNIHYTRLTDLAWSNDGKILLVSSTDGFCSVITFTDDELGEVYEEEVCKDETEKIHDKPVTSTHFEKTDGACSDKAVPATITQFVKIDANQGSTNELPAEKSVTIEIPSSKIIRSDEKFESPEKKHKPVTPIAIRRHPRTNVSPSTPSNVSKVNQVKITSFEGVVTPSKILTKTFSSRNSPQPIAVRRHPRTNSTPQRIVPKPTTSHDLSPTAIMDAWPIDEPKPIQIIEQENKKISKPDTTTQNLIVSSKMDTENTEDICLVYDDDDMESDGKMNQTLKLPPMVANPTPPSVTPKERIPRRVEFRTISTPKSKKKLL